MAESSSFANQLVASTERLFKLLENFAQARVLVVSDLMLDEFLTGQVERISTEAPVLIIRHETTPLNNNSQVAEVRNYLQQRWNPSSGLTQTLEYSLLLNRDGLIEVIIPLGNASVEYIDRTNIPWPGEPFVSALQGEANAKIRVLLTPDGKVQTSEGVLNFPPFQQKMRKNYD